MFTWICKWVWKPCRTHCLAMQICFWKWMAAIREPHSCRIDINAAQNERKEFRILIWAWKSSRSLFVFRPVGLFYFESKFTIVPMMLRAVYRGLVGRISWIDWSICMLLVSGPDLWKTIFLKLFLGLTDWLIDWLMDWLIDVLIDEFIDWWIDWSVCCLLAVQTCGRQYSWSYF